MPVTAHAISPVTRLPRAGLIRRLAALVYDALIVAGLLFVASVVGTLLAGTVLGLDFQQHQDALTAHPVVRRLFFCWCMAWWFGYFGWSWTRAGQTVGMKAWRLRVQRLDGRLPSWRDSLYRFVASLAGLTTLTLVLSPSRLALHDKLTLTEVLLLPKKTARPE